MCSQMLYSVRAKVILGLMLVPLDAVFCQFVYILYTHVSFMYVIFLCLV